MLSVDDILRRHDQVKQTRSLFDTHWQQIKDRMLPHGGDFTVTRSQGDKRTQEIYDSTPVIALERFASITESFLTPRNAKYQRLRSDQEELNKRAEVSEWFDTVTKLLFKVRESPRANFYGQVGEAYKSLGAYGNLCMYSEEAPFGMRYRSCHIGDTWIALNQHRLVDTIFYTFKLSAVAAMQKWGDETPDQVRKAVQQRPFEKFEFLHVVTPRKDVDPERADAQGMPWESAEVGILDKKIITTGGFFELPYNYARFSVNPGEDYGRGPGGLVLDDVKTLNELEKIFLRSGAKVADPPLLLFDDGVFGWSSRSVELTPGGLNYGGMSADGKPMIQPLHTGARLDITETMSERKRSSINDAFLVSLLQLLLHNPQMTAAEVYQRAKEQGWLMAWLGRLQSELLGPQTEREVNVLVRAGMVPPLPEALIEAQGEYKIEYESPATRLQRAEELLGLQRTVEVMAPFIQTNPSLLEVVDAEQAFREGAQINGVPASWIRSEEALAEIRAAQAEAAEEQDVIDQAPQAAAAFKDAAQGQALLRSQPAA